VQLVEDHVSASHPPNSVEHPVFHASLFVSSVAVHMRAPTSSQYAFALSQVIESGHPPPSIVSAHTAAEP